MISILPRTQTSLFRCACNGRREGDITSHSRFALASDMPKTKRLRRRLISVDVFVSCTVCSAECFLNYMPLRAVWPVSNIKLQADVPNVTPMGQIYCPRSS